VFEIIDVSENSSWLDMDMVDIVFRYLDFKPLCISDRFENLHETK